MGENYSIIKYENLLQKLNKRSNWLTNNTTNNQVMTL